MKNQRMLLLVMACVAAAFFLLLKLGFILHHDPLPLVFADGKLTLLAVLTLVVGASVGIAEAVQTVRNAANRVHVRQEAYQSASAATEARNRRAEELAADPARAQYASLVRRGENWSDSHIAYYENPLLTATCNHLRPIEQGMRVAGIDVRLSRNLEVSAKCHVNLPLLKQIFAVPSNVHYSEFYMGDPESQERPAAFLLCAEHNSMIHTVHPDDSAPPFPP